MRQSARESGCDELVRIPYPEGGVPRLEAGVEVGVARRDVHPTPRHGRVDHQRCAGPQGAGRPGEQPEGGRPRRHLQQIHAEHGIGPVHGPLGGARVEADGGADALGMAALAPRFDAVEGFGVELGGLPQEARQVLGEEGGVLPGAAGHFQHQPGAGKHAAKHRKDGALVAPGGRVVAAGIVQAVTIGVERHGGAPGPWAQASRARNTSVPCTGSAERT